MKSVAVVGTFLAGLRCAQELRAQGFGGELVLIGDEPHRPYDRPPLSKDFLLGNTSAEELELTGADELLSLEARWHLGSRAERLDAAAGTITLADGTEILADGVVVATGGRPRTLPGIADLQGVRTLRTLDDALALRCALTAGPASMVVIGAGFIGAEIASTCSSLGWTVTVVDAMPLPMAGVLGERMGAVCASLHDDHGVRMLTGVGAAGLNGTVRVTGARLTDGSELAADLVVIGIGVRPNTNWLTGSGLAIDDGVLVDSGCVTANPRVVAVGDVARHQCLRRGRPVRSEHWTAAAEQPAIAVRNLLVGRTVEHYTRPDYFWSEQYGHRIQFAGVSDNCDEVRVVDGDPAERKFVATYVRGEAVAGVLAMDSPKLFTRLRRGLDFIPVV